MVSTNILFFSKYFQGIGNAHYFTPPPPMHTGFKGPTKIATFSCCGEELRLVSEVPVEMKLFSWHHFCFSLNLTSRSAQMIFDDQVRQEPQRFLICFQLFPSGCSYMKYGNISNAINFITVACFWQDNVISKSCFQAIKLVMTGNGKGTIPGGGWLVVGQEKYTSNDRFNLLHSLKGDVADWVLLNESLSVNEMRKYVSCQGLPDYVNPVLQLNTSLSGWKLEGPSISYNLTSEDVCGRRLEDSLMILPFPVPQQKAFVYCRHLGGVLFVPQNQQENEKLLLLASKYETKCKTSQRAVAWLGITGNVTTKKWISLKDSSPINWNNFNSLHRTPGPNTCVYIGSSVFKGAWYSGHCLIKTCAVCQFEETSVFNLRGLCVAPNSVSTVFTLGGTLNGRPVFLGRLKYSAIYWNRSQWVLQKTDGVSAYTTMDRGKKLFPRGRMTWEDNIGICQNTKVSNLLSFIAPCHLFSLLPFYTTCFFLHARRGA